MSVLRWIQSRLGGTRDEGELLSKISAGGSRYELRLIEERRDGQQRVALRLDSTHFPILWGQRVTFWLDKASQERLRSTLRRRS